jgi:hypothetical protein
MQALGATALKHILEIHNLKIRKYLIALQV